MPKSAQKYRPPGYEKVHLQRRSMLDRRRESAPHRKLYNSVRYLKFRISFLATYPVCQSCKLAPATECHHVRKLSLHEEDLCDPRNCQALCAPCHNRITGEGG